MRQVAVFFGLITCIVAHSIATEGSPAEKAAAESKNAFYQRLVRSGAEPRSGVVEPGKVGGRPVVYVARFEAAGRRLITSTRNEVQVWNVPSMEPAQRPLALQEPVAAADLNSDGTLLLTIDGNGQLLVRRVGADDALWGRRHKGGFEWAEFSPDGRSVLLIERGDRTVRVLGAANGKEMLAIDDETSKYRVKAAVSRDGAWIVTSSLGPSRVWSAATGKPVFSAPRFGSVFAISPAGDRVAGLTDAGEISIFETGNGKGFTTVKAQQRDDSQVANIWALAFSPDGRFVAISKDDLGVRIWDAVTGKPASPALKPREFEIDPVSSILFTPDGRRVILGNRYGASIWDVSTGTRLAIMDETIHGWPAPVGIAVTPDGRYVAVNFGGPVELWEHRR